MASTLRQSAQTEFNTAPAASSPHNVADINVSLSTRRRYQLVGTTVLRHHRHRRRRNEQTVDWKGIGGSQSIPPVRQMSMLCRPRFSSPDRTTRAPSIDCFGPDLGADVDLASRSLMVETSWKLPASICAPSSIAVRRPAGCFRQAAMRSQQYAGRRTDLCGVEIAGSLICSRTGEYDLLPRLTHRHRARIQRTPPRRSNCCVRRLASGDRGACPRVLRCRRCATVANGDQRSLHRPLTTAIGIVHGIQPPRQADQDEGDQRQLNTAQQISPATFFDDSRAMFGVTTVSIV